MCNVKEYKKHLRNILDALELGKYERGYYRTEVGDEETDIVHKHYVSYISQGTEIYPDYTYNTFGTTKEQETRLDIDTFCGDYKVESSFIIITERNSMVFKFNPLSMDKIEIVLREDGEMVERVPLKDFLTEEQYFMYNTLYNMPPFEDIHDLLVMAHELRPELMRKKFKLSGMLSEEFVDMESESFLFEVQTS